MNQKDKLHNNHISDLMINKACCILLLLYSSHSSSGVAKLQWVCWAKWDRGWNLQAVRSLVQHPEAEVSRSNPRMSNVLLDKVSFRFVRHVNVNLTWTCVCVRETRGEFENDSSPDLNKDVYLQDIHCVSSLCKAYFRELPNPLLTYQLYDKFAVSQTSFTRFLPLASARSQIAS